MPKSSKSKLSQRNKQLLSLLLAVVLLFALNYFLGDPMGILPQPQSEDTGTIAQTENINLEALNGSVEIYVLDVGQGDSIFLMSPSGKTMLIDASISSMYPRIDEFLKSKQITKLDVVIGTHPHADHIGGMKKVVENYEIGEYYMPNAITTTKTFENLLDALNNKGVKVIEAAAGEDSYINWDNAIEIRILAPMKDIEYKDLNDTSVVCRLKFGENAIMLTGDAESLSEGIMLREFPASYFEADILKLGHHASHSSSSEAFLDAVNPKVAVGSLGEGNTYGHPHKETVDTLAKRGITFYRTDLNGTIHITLNGTDYNIETGK